MRRILLAATIAASLAAPSLAASPIGQVVGNGAQIDGVSVPSGTTLYSPTQVTTSDAPVVLHLSNGQTLNVAENTVAGLTATADAGVALEVSEGNVALRDPLTSGLVTLAASSQLLLNGAGQINEGTPVETVALCQPAGGGYELVQVPQSQVAEAKADGAIEPGSRPGVDATCDNDSNNDPVGSATNSGGRWSSMSTGTKAAIIGGGALAAAGTVVLIEDDDDDDPMSPVNR